MFQPKHKLIFGWLDHKFPHFHCQLQGWFHFHQLWNWGRFYISFLLRNLFFLEVHFLPESRDKCYNLHYAIVPIELASKLGNLLYIDQYCTTSLCIHGGILPKKREKYFKFQVKWKNNFLIISFLSFWNTSLLYKFHCLITQLQIFPKKTFYQTVHFHDKL